MSLPTSSGSAASLPDQQADANQLADSCSSLSTEDSRRLEQLRLDGFPMTVAEYLEYKEETRLLRENPESLPPGRSTAEVLEILNSLP